jgi:hypothetical protein
MVVQALLEGDAVPFRRGSGSRDRGGEGGDEGDVLDFPYKEPPKQEDYWDKRSREYAEELRKPGVPAQIPAEKMATDRQARIDYAVYVIARISSVAYSLESMYEQDVESMNLDPKWQPYTPFPMKKMTGKEWEERVVAGQIKRLGYRPYDDAYLKLRRKYRKDDIAKSKAGEYRFDHTSPALIAPNLLNYLRNNTGQTAPIHDQISEVKATLDRNDPEEAKLHEYVLAAERALDVMDDMLHVKLPPSTGLNEARLRQIIRLMIEGDVINVDPARFQGRPGTENPAAEFVQLPGRSEEELFQKKRPRAMVFYDTLKGVLDHPDVRKMLTTAPRIEPNSYTKTQSVSAVIDGKRYEVSGARMKELGVDPWAKPTNI